MCLAHANGARVVMNSNEGMADALADASARALWVSEALFAKPHRHLSAGARDHSRWRADSVQVLGWV